MRTVFGDTSFFVGFLNENDELHDSAMAHASDRSARIMTTTWVLMELANWFATSPARRKVRAYIDLLSRQPRVVIVPAMERYFSAGLKLYDECPDKNWSLTDCISFVVMREHGITEALTADHHFDQAGFRALLRSSSRQ